MSESEKNIGKRRSTPADAELLAAVPPRAAGRNARLGLFGLSNKKVVGIDT